MIFSQGVRGPRAALVLDRAEPQKPDGQRQLEVERRPGCQSNRLLFFQFLLLQRKETKRLEVKLCSLVSQVTYQNFGRYYYNVRQCAAADLGAMTWLAMHCDSELDWICKIPRGAAVFQFSFHIKVFSNKNVRLFFRKY